MNRVDHPGVPPSLIEIGIITASLRRVAALLRHRFLLQSKYYQEREVKHQDDDREDDALLVQPLERGVHAIFPDYVRGLRCLLDFYFFAQELFEFSEFGQFNGFVILQGTIESFFVFTC